MRLVRELLMLSGLTLAGAAVAFEHRGEAGMEGWAFSTAGAQGQSRTNASLRAQLELWHSFNDAHDTVTATPFLRVDAEDEERTHADVREAFWRHSGTGYELRAGMRQVFWGVTEGMHLVDIINQTDMVESIDGERKLGQGMLNLSLERDGQTFDFFVLTGARERTFPGQDGRLRLPLVVDTRLTSWESSRENQRLDLAARWQLNTSALRLGISAFSGTAREPELRPVVDPAQIIFAPGPVPAGFLPGYQPVLAPHYPLIQQLGVDSQYTHGDWLWKLEVIARKGGLQDYRAADIGFEYTQVGIFGSPMDIGWLAEYLHDSRDEKATTPFEHDVLVGTRLIFNDAASSDLLFGLIADPHSHERFLSIEATTRFGESWRGSLELRRLENSRPVQTPFEFLVLPDGEYKLRNLTQDNFARLEVTWFF